MKGKLIILIMLFLSIAFMSEVNAKYEMQEIVEAVNINIDRTKPKITVLEIKNNNLGYETYANHTHEIKINIQVVEKNIDKKEIKPEEINVQVGEEIASLEQKQCKKIQETQEGSIWEITLQKIEGNGMLQIILPEGIITDTAGWKNEKVVIDTKIEIDNKAPILEGKEELKEAGKVMGIITANETIREKEGWNLAANKKSLGKEFTKNTSIEIEIEDYAQNSTKIELPITKAEYLSLNYASHNSLIGWRYGYKNQDIVGNNEVTLNKMSKVEALAFHVEGNLPIDLLEVKTHIHTYWGEGATGICKEYGTEYYHGYNPQNNQWKSMANEDKINMQGKEYFVFGGSGINATFQTDSKGNKPIPYEIAGEYRHGISGIAMRLKQECDYTVIYQIHEQEVGWMEPKSDGEEAMKEKDKPFSSVRVALVRKEEKQKILEEWKKDIGKHV